MLECHHPCMIQCFMRALFLYCEHALAMRVPTVPMTFFYVSLLNTDQDVSRCYSAMDGRRTPQSRRATPDREVQH